MFLCLRLYGNSEVCGSAALTLQQFLLDSGRQLSPLGTLHDAVDVAVQVPLASLHQLLQQVTHLLHTETSPQVHGGRHAMCICHICTGGSTKGEQPSDSFLFPKGFGVTTLIFTISHDLFFFFLMDYFLKDAPNNIKGKKDC